MRIRWQTFWIILGGWLLLLAVWLVWQLPGQGFFRLDLDPLYLPQDGMVLVTLKEGKPDSSYSPASYGIGWQVFLELWSLILLSMLVGYPFGVVYQWLCQLLAGEKSRKQTLSPQENDLMDLAASQSDKLWLQALR